ncbi:hypothetical protein BC829DRAFT_430920 [Chytridium lagenaria]|nr:hypothetical protein BC829DRAFT_430920 [Chytridium lagenaria]
MSMSGMSLRIEAVVEVVRRDERVFRCWNDGWGIAGWNDGVRQWETVSWEVVTEMLVVAVVVEDFKEIGEAEEEDEEEEEDRRELERKENQDGVFLGGEGGGLETLEVVVDGCCVLLSAVRVMVEEDSERGESGEVVVVVVDVDGCMLRGSKCPRRWVLLARNSKSQLSNDGFAAVLSPGMS